MSDIHIMISRLRDELGEAAANKLLCEAMGVSPQLAKKVGARQHPGNGDVKAIYTYTHDVTCMFCGDIKRHVRKVTKQDIKEDMHTNKVIDGLTCMVTSYTRRCDTCRCKLGSMDRTDLEQLCFELLNQRQFISCNREATP